ncbi:extracellular catalytic domain type 1 short-chain-length polyhydroxyalkanoate depolymerase [Methylobacterium brachythecii]|uniref:Poly(Hydroxyalkanoate) depolymerase family esterase n=1 Tax=Methylobacterium brachythecii TaxID=1176177 RepID=A0A7W6F4T0_9HYPH|nr:PHB depolymerase family esterase [Methylobacterium brachythecii]MBB3900637.1 poly(hydroxyalkanoate) depolymerase family esterase [Methylobacterium brachythecii]
MTERGFKMPNLADLTEATRLARGGRLGKASALIQRSLSSGLEAGDTTGSRTTQADRHAAILPERLREGLGQLLRGLRGVPVVKGLKGFEFHGLQPEPESRPNEHFVARSFSNVAGARDYKLFIPSGHAGPRPLVVMLHGCTQSPDDFAAGTRMNELAQEDGIYVAYPGQTRGANAQKCWNWFETRDQGRERGEAGIIAGLTRAIIAEHPIDPLRVYVAGLSAGGAAAANIARAYPDVFAGVGVHSGLAAGCARDLTSALMAMRAGAPGAELPGGESGFGTAQATQSVRVPTIVFHGGNDTTVNPRNGEEVLAQAGIDSLSQSSESGTRPGGHRYTRTLYRDTDGQVQAESWRVDGSGHAWSGGSSTGSYTDPLGPDASRAMLDFFAQHRLGSGLNP